MLSSTVQTRNTGVRVSKDYGERRKSRVMWGLTCVEGKQMPTTGSNRLDASRISKSRVAQFQVLCVCVCCCFLLCLPVYRQTR